MATQEERQVHDQWIGLLWRTAAAQIASGQSARDTLSAMERELARCAEFGCFRAIAEMGS